MPRFQSRRPPWSSDEALADDTPLITAGDGLPAADPRTAPDDPFLRALESLDDVLAQESGRLQHLRRRIALLRSERGTGRTYADIIADEPRPRLVEMLADTTRSLDSAGAVVRRTEARALHEAGLTMDEIAVWFGVSRQRVSALLRDR